MASREDVQFVKDELAKLCDRVAKKETTPDEAMVYVRTVLVPDTDEHKFSAAQLIELLLEVRKLYMNRVMAMSNGDKKEEENDEFGF